VVGNINTGEQASSTTAAATTTNNYILKSIVVCMMDWICFVLFPYRRAKA